MHYQTLIEDYHGFHCALIQDYHFPTLDYLSETLQVLQGMDFCFQIQILKLLNSLMEMETLNHKGFTMTAWLFHLILLWIELTTTRSCIRHDTARFESNKINQVVLSLLFSRNQKIFYIFVQTSDFRPECFCFCLCSVSRVYQNCNSTSIGTLSQIPYKGLWVRL